MEGTIKTLKTGFGFIEESTTNRFWYFSFHDLTKLQMIREGSKVRFEPKESANGVFKEKLNSGLFKDANLNSRNPKPQHSIAPAAHKVEILAEQESIQDENPVVDCGTF